VRQQAPLAFRRGDRREQPDAPSGAIMSREVLFEMVDTSGYGLEIGPSYNPFFPKSQGFNIEILDYIDQEGLKKKYSNDPRAPVEKIEPVDYVSDGRPMSDVIGRQHIFDFVVASHVVEHTTDLVRFFQDCSALLKPSGVLLLIVPDSMSCFDVFRPLSSTGQVLQAYVEKRVRHAPGVGFDHIAYNAVREGEPGWWLSDTRPLRFQYGIDDAFRFFKSLYATTQYHDLHRWQFSPSSFRLICNDLFEGGMIDLREASFSAPENGYEFFVSLSRSGAGPGMSRLDLARAMLRDLKRIPDAAI